MLADIMDRLKVFIVSISSSTDTVVLSTFKVSLSILSYIKSSLRVCTATVTDCLTSSRYSCLFSGDMSLLSNRMSKPRVTQFSGVRISWLISLTKALLLSKIAYITIIDV